MEILPAQTDQAAEICEVVRRSITELCAEDHQNDPAVLDAWLQGKTPARVRQWLLDPSNEMLVAELDGKIAGVGCARGSDIILNYVAPDARFRGISHAILMALEHRIRELRGGCVSLESTTTALQFYRSRGYFGQSEPRRKFGIVAWPLKKQLGPPHTKGY